jgi:hypothetical protein
MEGPSDVPLDMVIFNCAQFATGFVAPFVRLFLDFEKW